MKIVWAYLSLIGATFLWGSSFVALKVAVNFYSPFVVIFFRMFIACVVFIFIWSRIKPGSLSIKQVKLILLMCFFEPCLYFLFEGFALKYTSAGQASLIVSTLPLMVAILACFTLKEKVSFNTIFGFLLAILGVVLLTMASDVNMHSPSPFLGNLLEFIAMITASGYIILARYLSATFHPFFLAFAQAFIGAVFFLPFMLLFGDINSLELKFWPVVSIVYLGFMVTFLAYSLYNFSLSRLEASKASAFTNLIPVFSIGLSWFLLDEKLNSVQIIGIGLVVLGIIYSQNFLRFLKKV
ncbi:DMT family transporter [Desulfonauticus submarinus]